MQEVNDSLVSVNMDKEKLAKQKEIQKLENKDFELTKLKYQEGIIAKLDLNQKQDLNKLLVDIVRYLTNFAKKLLNFNNCKNKKGEQRKYVLDENEKEFMNIALIFLKTRFFSMDFIKTTHLGIIFSYILDNLDVADKDSCSLIKEIEELIDLMKKQCLEY